MALNKSVKLTFGSLQIHIEWTEIRIQILSAFLLTYTTCILKRGL